MLVDEGGVGLAEGEGVAFSPLSQGEDDREEVAAGVGDGLFGIAGLGAARAGRWADAGRAAPVTGLALTLLILSWAAIAQLPWSLSLLIGGIVILDFAVQAVHVSNQHLLTAAHPDRTSSVIGSYMVFYSLGSALGAAAIFTAHGWAGSSLLGAGFAACALAVWATDRRLPLDSANLRSENAGTR